MPAEKRKCDEDTWIVTQSKKFKCSQLLSNVYDLTLAQLRMGARNFFQSVSTNASSNQNRAPSSSPFHSPPASPVMRDIISHNDMTSSFVVIRPVEICVNCAYKKEGWEKCYYCEKVVCHSITCDVCQDGFCSNCCITKYDKPSGETFSCYRCLK